MRETPPESNVATGRQLLGKKEKEGLGGKGSPAGECLGSLSGIQGLAQGTVRS